MAQIMMFIGAALVIGAGLWGLVAGKPIVLNSGKQLTKGQTMGVHLAFILVGLGLGALGLFS